MLLRIDVYPHDAKLTAPAASVGSRRDAATVDLPPSPLPPLYANLACSTAPQDAGHLLSMGRKLGDVVFAHDKSVSRQHSVLRLCCANKTYSELEKENTTVLPPPQPRNDEEIEVCGKDPQHMCIVLENTGKVGSFVVQEKEITSDDKKSAADGADTDDDTDDEQVGFSAAVSQGANAGSSNVFSTMVQTLLHGKDLERYTQKWVGPDQSLVLANLAEHKPVLVQCGKLGSCLVLTRQALSIVRTSAAAASDKQQVALQKKRAYALGTMETKTVTDTSTHVLAVQRDATPKQLVAWCRGWPIVTPDWLEQLWNRSSPSDAIDDYSHCQPEPDGNDFWNTPPSRHLWSSCTYLATKYDGMELVICAVGAQVIKLYDCKNNNEAMALARECFDDSSTHCFGLAETSKSRRKLPKWLAEQGVPMVRVQTVAQCVTAQTLLQDAQGNDIGVEYVASITPPADETKATASNAKSMERSTEPAAAEQDKETVTRTAAKEPEFPTAKDDSGTKEAETEMLPVATNEPPVPEEPSQTTAAESSKVMQVETLHEEQDHMAKSSKATDDAASKKNKKKKRSKSPVQDDVEAPPPKKRFKSSKAHDDTDAPLERKTLDKKNKDGWLVAAPKGRQRCAYRRTTEEIEKATGKEAKEMQEMAPTEVCKGMLLPTPLGQSLSERTTTTARSSGPNFKRFRKNSVIRTRHVIALKAAVPKDTEQTQQYQEEREEMERQKCQADELFRDPGTRTTSTSRRRRIRQ